MTNRELGRPVAGARRAQSRRPPPRRPDPKGRARKASPAWCASRRDQRARRGAERVQGIVRAAGRREEASGEAPIAIDRLHALVKAQVEKFAAEGTDVAFRVAMKDGKVSLTAKPVKTDNRSED